jgi:AcrR family transcriptional regulator
MFPLRDLVEVAPDAGRRDRNKAEVRTNLHDAAVRLFSERGYEATSVDDLAEAAGVSLRTFFRYFASKDDVLFARVMDPSRFLADLRVQPATRTPVAAIHATYLAQPALSASDIQVHLLFHRAVGSSPTLLGRYFDGIHQFRAAVADALATRDGRRRVTDVDRLAATIGQTVLDHAYEGWLARGARGDLRSAVTAAFASLDDATIASG